MLRKLAVFLVVGMVFTIVLAVEGAKKDPFKLTIIHTNDNHANHEPQPSGDGGDARQATVIKQIRQEVPHHLTIDAGDRFTGTLFHTRYKGLDNVPFLNKIGFQALAIGNHEFDEGDEGLAKLATEIQCPIVAANVDVSQSKALNGKIKPYTIVTVGGQDIGIIGVTTIDTKTGSSPSKDVTFDGDYAKVVQTYVDALTMKGINKIVVLSHIGLSEDLKLAGQVRGVDVIVGGHSHTLLSKTYREAKNTYPMKVNGKDGQPVYIVQAGGGDNRFVGRLDLEFDGEGVITKANGDSILLSKYITPDPEIAAEVEKLAKPLNDMKKKALVDRNDKPVTLNADWPADKVRDEETLLGNFVTDAMRQRAKTQIALQGGGGLRAGLNKEQVTVGDIFRVMPFTNKLNAFRLKGTDLLDTIEHGVSRYGESGNGRFLQVSGLRYSFDPTRKKGERVLSVEVQGTDKMWSRVDPLVIYTVASDNYIRTGGDDFTMLRDKAIDPDEDLPPVQDVLMDALKDQSPVEVLLEGRIKIVKR